MQSHSHAHVHSQTHIGMVNGCAKGKKCTKIKTSILKVCKLSNAFQLLRILSQFEFRKYSF